MYFCDGALYIYSLKSIHQKLVLPSLMDIHINMLRALKFVEVKSQNVIQKKIWISVSDMKAIKYCVVLIILEQMLWK